MKSLITNIFVILGFTLYAGTAVINGVRWNYTEYGDSVTIGPGYSIGGTFYPAIAVGTSEITIPSEIDGRTVTSIGDSAFKGCLLKRVTFPGSIKTVARLAFYQCTSLEEVNILDLTSWSEINIDTNLAHPSEYAKHFYVNGVPIDENLIVPDSVKTIGTNAFYRFNSLLSVTIPSNVTRISGGAFAKCKSLKV